MTRLGPNPVLMQHPQQVASRVGAVIVQEARNHTSQNGGEGLQPPVPGNPHPLSVPSVHAPKHAQEPPT